MFIYINSLFSLLPFFPFKTFTSKINKVYSRYMYLVHITGGTEKMVYIKV